MIQWVILKLPTQKKIDENEWNKTKQCRLLNEHNRLEWRGANK